MVNLVHRSRRRRCAGNAPPQKRNQRPGGRATTLASLTLKYFPTRFACVLTNVKSLNFTLFGTFRLPLPLTLYPQGDAQSISCVAPGESDMPYN